MCDSENFFEKKIQLQGFVLFDGATGTCLESRGFKLCKNLWTTSLLINNVDAIKKLHHDYFNNGSDIITTCSYQISFKGEPGLSSVDAEKYFKRSISIAKFERDSEKWEKKNKFVACSISPIGANMKINGIPGEYSGSYIDNMKEKDVIEFHKKRILTAINESPDVLLFETFPSLKEIKIICNEILDRIYINNKKKIKQLPVVVISFSCGSETSTFNNDKIGDCAKFLNSKNYVYSIGINCTYPKYVLNLIKTLKKCSKKRIYASPNSGELYVFNKDKNKFVWKESCSVKWEDFALKMKESGADLIGCCCRTNPEKISLISKSLKKKYSPN